MSNDYFGTPQEIEAARAKRRAEVQAWGKSVIANADRVHFGYKDDWDQVDEEPEEADEQPVEDSQSSEESEPQTEEPQTKTEKPAAKPSSTRSSTAK